ncbi:gliding motility lipoprotein GldD [Lutimonas zeaxanthinifaciens]|uniref:gliding motility lipoprotein GldD n=1 Tax=Lutimonas zeaxanthinifaciens TaxID=3060215 RepID=UPI00265CAD0F|nr:gliding motility lipoprotein GldD [Lutimonas sp. YSD2104]WKK66551.1 gliding motility lipoprotein GldD [Lutimonas sp. YSD2104]
MKLLNQSVIALLLILLSVSCKEEVLPKPKAQLRLEYPSAQYKEISSDCPYIFEISTNSKIQINNKCWANLDYPGLKASVNMTYRPVEGNLKELLIEAEKLTFNHTIKADGISSIPYSNKEKRVYGAIFEVTGNAASPIQFHVTDSTDNFITGAVYFNVQPNYDSIKPAINYLRQDIMRMIESMQWKNK